MHYLKLPWSHGQSDLVHAGFAQGFKFADEALARKEGVLIQYVKLVLFSAECVC
jgi:tyrosine-protein phosphatase MSG5